MCVCERISKIVECREERERAVETNFLGERERGGFLKKIVYGTHHIYIFTATVTLREKEKKLAIFFEDGKEERKVETIDSEAEES